MIGGTEWWYYFPGCVWLFSYIQHPFFQKSFFWSLIVGNALAVFFLLVVNLHFLVGGIIDNDDWGNLYYPIAYDVMFFGFNAIVYYLLFPQMVAYYRWREQGWWNEKWEKWLTAGGIEFEMDSDMGDDLAFADI